MNSLNEVDSFFLCMCLFFFYDQRCYFLLCDIESFFRVCVYLLFFCCCSLCASGVDVAVFQVSWTHTIMISSKWEAVRRKKKMKEREAHKEFALLAENKKKTTRSMHGQNDDDIQWKQRKELKVTHTIIVTSVCASVFAQ